jgi:O-antigen/teichoic acid export membrane protein
VPRLLAAPRDAEVPEGALRFGVFQALSGVLLQLQERGGVVAIAILNGSRVQAGFASIAIGVALAPVWAVRQAFNAQLPGLVAALGENVEAAERSARRTAHNLQLALVPLALAGAIWSDQLLTLALGHRFHGAATALGIALAALPLAPPVALGVQVSALRLRPEDRFKALAAGTVAFLAVATATIPGSGATGVAIAVVAAAAVTLAGLVLTIPRLLGVRRALFTAAAVGLILLAGTVL